MILFVANHHMNMSNTMGMSNVKVKVLFLVLISEDCNYPLLMELILVNCLLIWAESSAVGHTSAYCVPPSTHYCWLERERCAQHLYTWLAAWSKPFGVIKWACEPIHTHTNPWGRWKWPYANAITRLIAHFKCSLMSDLVICKLKKVWSYMTRNVLTETKCLLNNTHQIKPNRCGLWWYFDCKLHYDFLCYSWQAVLPRLRTDGTK